MSDSTAVITEPTDFVFESMQEVFILYSDKKSYNVPRLFNYPDQVGDYWWEVKYDTSKVDDRIYPITATGKASVNLVKPTVRKPNKVLKVLLEQKFQGRIIRKSDKETLIDISKAWESSDNEIPHDLYIIDGERLFFGATKFSDSQRHGEAKLKIFKSFLIALDLAIKQAKK